MIDARNSILIESIHVEPIREPDEMPQHVCHLLLDLRLHAGP
jgi:hypothetical protein